MVLYGRIVTVSALLLLTGAVVALAASIHYGYGNSPQEAMDRAIENAISESRAGCIGRDWSPDIERDCRHAGYNRAFFGENGEYLGVYECQAQGSDHRGSCR